MSSPPRILQPTFSESVVDDAFLSGATELLSSTLDYESALSAVARLAVPDLADWCSIHVLDGRELRHIAAAHEDPERAGWARELGTRYPPDPKAARGVHNVLRTGVAETFTEITDDMLKSTARDEEHLRILRAVGMRQVIIAPLTARGRTVGAISFVSSSPGREYNETDVARAVRLGRLAGTAIDNAILYRSAQEAERRMALIAEASAVVLQESDHSEALSRILELAGQVLSADAHAIWLKERSDGRWAVAASRGLSAAYIESATREIAGVPDDVVALDGPAAAEDVETTPWLAGHRDAHLAEGTRSLLVAPLRPGGELQGTIAFYYRARRAFTDGEKRAAQALANLAATALRLTSDMADRKQWEREQARMAAIVSSSEDAIVSKDLDGIVTSWNASAERIYGWKAEDIIGLSKGVVIPPDLPDELPSILRKIRAGERINHYETARIRRDGVRIDVSISVSPIKDSAGRIIGASTITRDITERKRTERDLRLKQEEVETLNKRLKRAMQETHHRVKNNLQIIAAMLDLKVMDPSHERTVPVEELARLGGHVRTLAVVHDVLTRYLREDEEDQILSVRSVFTRLIPLLEQTAGRRPVRADIADADLTSKQATALALITNELVSNAVKHGAGTISLRLAQRAGRMTLSVRDEGPGFPKGFDPAVSANTGLELVGSLAATDLGGTVNYVNTLAGGAEANVTFALPATTNPGATARA